MDNSGIFDRFKHVLSVKSAGYFKPAVEVYQLARAAFQVSPAEVALVSANDWDTAAAQMSELKGVWLSRKRRTTTVCGVTPDFVVEGLRDFLQVLERDR